MTNRKFNLYFSFFLLLSFCSCDQREVDLSQMLQDEKVEAVKRTITTYEDGRAVEMNAEQSDGLGILSEVSFETGTIEIDLLGENNPGKSFIGVAFNVQDHETYEAIYFRPFNFVAEEQIRRDHMVQYIFHPEFTWRKLRTDRTGQFESEISAPPDPEGWFKAVIKVKEKNVEVYVNDIIEPVLDVERLTTSKSNRIAIWTGFGSSGRFKNLKINTDR